MLVLWNFLEFLTLWSCRTRRCMTMNSFGHMARLLNQTVTAKEASRESFSSRIKSGKEEHEVWSRELKLGHQDMVALLWNERRVLCLFKRLQPQCRVEKHYYTLKNDPLLKLETWRSVYNGADALSFGVMRIKCDWTWTHQLHLHKLQIALVFFVALITSVECN